MKPLVSVLMTARNSLATLPWAFGSLLCQTYSRWEAVFVDDASDDGTEEFVRRLGNRQVRYIRNQTRIGRGASRQMTLEAARGEFVTTLDVDDWMFPDCLEKMVSALSGASGVCLVSAGIGVVDEQRRLTGVRTAVTEPVVDSMERLEPPPVFFPSAMFRRNPGPSQYFRAAIPSAEDFDFMIRMLLGKRFLRLDGLVYAYSNASTQNVTRAVITRLYCARIVAEYWKAYPFRSFQLAAYYLASAAAWAVGGWAFAGLAVASRSARPTAQHEAQYYGALAVVEPFAAKLEAMLPVVEKSL